MGGVTSTLKVAMRRLREAAKAGAAASNWRLVNMLFMIVSWVSPQS
jgi:hypothetical protein